MTFGGLLTEGEEINCRLLPEWGQRGRPRLNPRKAPLPCRRETHPPTVGKCLEDEGLGSSSLHRKLFPAAWPKLSPWKVLASGSLLIPGSLEEQPCPAGVVQKQGGWHAKRKVCGQGRQGQKQQSPVLRPGGREEQLPPTCRIGGPIKGLFNIYSESILNEALENIDAGIKVNSV